MAGGDALFAWMCFWQEKSAAEALGSFSLPGWQSVTQYH